MSAPFEQASFAEALTGGAAVEGVPSASVLNLDLRRPPPPQPKRVASGEAPLEPEDELARLRRLLAAAEARAVSAEKRAVLAEARAFAAEVRPQSATDEFQPL